jgi:glucose dehydrogenase
MSRDSIAQQYAVPVVSRAIAVAALTWASIAPAQAPIPAGDWPTYSRDLAGTRYSPLTAIDTGNVGALEIAWRVPVARSPNDDEAGGPSGNPQATPIVS